MSAAEGYPPVRDDLCLPLRPRLSRDTHKPNPTHQTPWLVRARSSSLYAAGATRALVADGAVCSLSSLGLASGLALFVERDGVTAAAVLDGERLALKRVSLAGLPPAQRDETLRAVKREVRALSSLRHHPMPGDLTQSHLISLNLT